MLCNFRNFSALVAALSLCGIAAADDNSVLLLQDSQNGSGNTLFIDQSLASGSLIAGDLSGSTPAQQIGGANEADLTLEGEGAVVLLSQDNGAALQAAGNVVSVFGAELSDIAVSQFGSGNMGTVNVTGTDSFGALLQLGDDNVGSVRVSGNNASGSLNQIGNQNTFGLEVTGDATNVFAAQIGDNLQTIGAAPLQVYSNGVTLNITTTTLR